MNNAPRCPLCGEPYETDGQSFACANPLCPDFNVWYDPQDLNLEDDLEDASDEGFPGDDVFDEDDQPRLF